MVVELLPQEEFKYLGVLFSDSKMEHEMKRQIGEASLCKWVLSWTFVVKMELSRKAKLSTDWSIYVPTLVYGHELWL